MRNALRMLLAVCALGLGVVCANAPARQIPVIGVDGGSSVRDVGSADGGTAQDDGGDSGLASADAAVDAGGPDVTEPWSDAGPPIESPAPDACVIEAPPPYEVRCGDSLNFDAGVTDADCPTYTEGELGHCDLACIDCRSDSDCPDSPGGSECLPRGAGRSSMCVFHAPLYSCCPEQTQWEWFSVIYSLFAWTDNVCDRNSDSICTLEFRFYPSGRLDWIYDYWMDYRGKEHVLVTHATTTVNECDRQKLADLIATSQLSCARQVDGWWYGCVFDTPACGVAAQLADGPQRIYAECSWPSELPRTVSDPAQALWAIVHAYFGFM